MSSFANSERYDCIVIGLGGHGSATIAELAKRGQKVLGIEQFHRIHEKGMHQVIAFNIRNNFILKALLMESLESTDKRTSKILNVMTSI